MAAKKKWESAGDADIIHEFCRVDANSITYSQYVGLMLNISRIREGRVLGMLRALCYSKNNEDLPVSLFEIMAASQQQAEDLALDVNVNRRLAKMANQGMGQQNAKD